MKNLLPILLLLTNITHAQKYQYTRAEIKHVADSVMRYYIRDTLLSYCSNELNTDNYVYYRYTDSKGRIKYHEVPRGRSYTKGEFKDIEVWYRIKYPYPKCAIADTVRGETSLVLGRKLDVKRAPAVSFIPDYVWERDSCDYTVRHYVPLKNGSQGR